MKKKKKLIIIICLILILIFGCIIVFLLNKDKNLLNVLEENNTEEYVEVLPNNTKINNSKKLKENKNIDGLIIQNIRLTMKDDQTLLQADVFNNTGNDFPMTPIDITFYDKEGNEMITFGGIINQTLSGEVSPLYAECTLDYADAYDFKIELKHD